MQSGYGEMQQFMVDASLFSSPSNAPPPPQPPNPSEIHHHPFSHPHPHPPPHFAHFGHPVPITQQLFQHQQTHHPHHQFQLFHHHHHQQQHMRLDQGLEPENPRGPTSFLEAMNFKLGVSESNGGVGGGSRDNGLNDDDGILHGGDDDGSDESRLHHHHHHHPWHRDDDQSAPNIKQPFWRPLDIDFINPSNKRPSKDKQPELDITSNIKHFKKSNEVLDLDANYKLFSELEAIYKPGSTPITGGGGGGGPGGGTSTNNCNNQTGSGSALTGDDNQLMPVTKSMGPTVDNISDTSNGGDAPPLPVLNKQFQKGSSSSCDRRKRAKRRQQRQLASITMFFESLVKQLMAHQENLHRRFLEVMEKRDQERTSREEAWRKQESAKANREATARAQERALAASRESAIIAFLEKITGESLNLPTNSQFQHQNNEEHDANLEINNNQSSEVEKHKAPDNNVGNNNYNIVTGSSSQHGSSRWPKAEVQALIRVRSAFESKFQEPGLKGPLWEEASLAMLSLGYSRSAKRCKEKWENINKYFRKAKDSGKKRPQHSKTCPYFQQLDQLYSKSNNANSGNEERKEKTNSELLDAIVVSNEGGKRNVNKEFNDPTNEGDDADEDGEEGQGESQELEQAQGQENLNNKDESTHFLMNQ